jgi:hypothetical protein
MVPAGSRRPDETRFALHQVIDWKHNGVVTSIFQYPAS